MHVLITGGGGFIGRHLVESQLKQGHTVTTIDLHLDPLSALSNNPQLYLVEGSITDRQLMARLINGIDVIYHLASAHLDVSLSDQIYRDVNITATKHLLRLAKAAGVQRFVHCSSVGVIGDVTRPPANETTDCQPTNIYEKTKLEGERAAIAFAKAENYPVVIVRPAWVYGPGCPRTAKLLRTVRKGHFVIFGKGENLRHPIYIKDAVEGLEQAAVAEVAPGELYILGGSQPVTIRELLSTIAEAEGVSIPKLRLPMWLGLLAGNMLELAFKPLGKAPPFSRRSLDFFLKNNAYDISRARQDLGFKPAYNLAGGMRETVKQLRSNG